MRPDLIKRREQNRDKSCSKYHYVLHRGCTAPFHIALTSAAQDLSFLLKLKHIAFSFNISKTLQSSEVSGWRHAIARPGASSVHVSEDRSSNLCFPFPWSHYFFHWDQERVVKKATKDNHYFILSQTPAPWSRRTPLLTTVISCGTLIMTYSPKKRNRMAVHCLFSNVTFIPGLETLVQASIFN